MKPLTLLVLVSPPHPLYEDIEKFNSLEIFEEVKILPNCYSFEQSLLEIKTDYFLLMNSVGKIEFSQETIYEFIVNLNTKDAGIVYSDYTLEGSIIRLNDYLPGSVRDDFDFGSLILFSTEKMRRVLKKYGQLNYRKYGALYDMRLKLSIHYPIIHVGRTLYTVEGKYNKLPYEAIFSYVDPANREYQEEMESIFTSYLKEVGAYIPPTLLKNTDTGKNEGDYPCLASIVIPVKNREKTIGDALQSAISQKTNFPYNVIVVDNHSTDKTGEIIDAFSRKYSAIKKIVPESLELNIGGCWNEAIFSPICGKYAVQLDSDDMYETEYALQVIVDKLRYGKYAMVVGTYRTVDENLNEIPPGVVDHREWTEDNGHNNLLRVGGLGAPRAFDTSVVRRFGFKDISYGEDYAMGLRISREYKVGRILDSLYLARRWSGNTDSQLDPEKKRVLNEIKDVIRTAELKERIAIVKSFDNDR